ncbi:Crp/Fnr family transcriptional regulator [Rhizorhabdus wittichii]|jgi:CRP-like cAMP-binding protein|uniref:Transcriptional regulator, Crp/Fnr family n=2 Tax=Rhizorhabdus wittichii TaxID=160791 RepID=A0A9J9LD17_RHIWR|nr:Crp/Fnr family transcriptional regulator [Rhizorhabdus wittichii]ABQ69062.1 transcriptional regulator, Crp/Fnr family [Rhizorhabdus wittichii RW1]ARR54104.1 Crp/Fnr family transcriptional regulator [Rhizorhabdus wittichii DC-6]QTH20550.1 Crp/Fnr family transcriptional regulator [Rhizorhabdus wittichii]
MTPAELAAHLPKGSVFADCDDAELADLLSVGSLQPTRSNEEILRQGDEGTSLLLVLDGVVRISLVTPNGREIILDYAEAGAVLGEIAVLDGQPRTASATAMWPGRLLRIPRASFFAFLERHPKVAVRLLREMARRLRETDSTIESDRAFTTAPRLARYLKRLTDQKMHGAKLTRDLSQSELGSFVGISRENINRQLAAWASEGVIELTQGKIRIVDPDYLTQIAEAAE